ncbi:hypothetical protein [Actinomadura litoris]|uniref:hypothetical protein n=1 Tax=Actinomadura litoris TaxID=2678616 RepID=UPI001FA6D878|nr:hypothetical protein [Actinomadura litoris]
MPDQTTPALPNPPGGHTAYGITVHEIGEDGECIVAFGHHNPRRFFAACNHLARTVWGWPNLGDDRDATWADTEAVIFQVDGWFDDRLENPDWEWELHQVRPAGRADEPVPITMWNV